MQKRKYTASYYDAVSSGLDAEANYMMFSGTSLEGWTPDALKQLAQELREIGQAAPNDSDNIQKLQSAVEVVNALHDQRQRNRANGAR